MNQNSENTKIGKEFQEKTINILENYYDIALDSNVKIPIGNPAKDRKFDGVTKDKKYVITCKCFTWTETGNVPSAKLAAINEIVFYMSYLPSNTKKIIALSKSYNIKKNETLAEYYYRTNKHLINDIELVEIDTSSNKVNVITKQGEI